ncbi:hypothetical protein BpHYR1_040927 [Brachionus plicatilis]|uniref:Uncharacterized protein n=1 Tax=Brachionus plicatilis TaxID=10195 RepID=A0A3M7SHB3_BRAPC|nr:hypothetical protein BpHYR1_040927 [Brachionus plicatilis]
MKILILKTFFVPITLYENFDITNTEFSAQRVLYNESLLTPFGASSVNLNFEPRIIKNFHLYKCLVCFMNFK